VKRKVEDQKEEISEERRGGRHCWPNISFMISRKFLRMILDLVF
jgi:hypothetical protein